MIPRTTLRDHVHKRIRKKSGTIPRPGKRGTLGVLSDSLENEVVAYVKKMSEIFYGLTRMDVRRLVFEIAEKKGLKHGFHDGVAGEKWFRLFCKRHPDMTLRTPESTSINRLVGFRPEAVERFFELIRSLDEKYHFDPTRIFNVDETKHTTVSRPPKVLSSKGIRRVGCVASAERGIHVTTTHCMSAAGAHLPPQVIFPRTKVTQKLTRNAAPGSIFAATYSD